VFDDEEVDYEYEGGGDEVDDDDETYELTPEGALVLAHWLPALLESQNYNLNSPGGFHDAASYLVAEGLSEYSVDATKILLVFGKGAFDHMRENQNGEA
jgi:hypothetical protein